MDSYINYDEYKRLQKNGRTGVEAFIQADQAQKTYMNEWEEKNISALELMEREDSIREVIANEREWLLGGKHMDWKYYFNKWDGSLTLLRR
jgi:hypothetical protein